METLNDPALVDFNEMDLEQKIMNRTSKFRLPEGISGSEALSRLKARLAETESEQEKDGSRIKKNFRVVYLVSSIAAGLLMLFGIWKIWIQNQSINVIAEKGKMVEYRLPDGSDVRMNADSRITLDKKNFNNKRSIRLEGEAFFNVTKGTMFTISASRGGIRVLGTSFNVYSRTNAFKVSCMTGKILVTSGRQSVTIIPGESAELKDTDLIRFADSKINSVAAWIDGEFNFDNSPLNMVFDEMERQFNVKFAGQNFGDRFFTGSITNKDLKEALDIVCIPLGLNYEIGNKGEIFISEVHK
jgi:ferric-dicitrate binding protein FerR (iron transport regulator)